jgi:hypothetical protein
MQQQQQQQQEGQQQQISVVDVLQSLRRCDVVVAGWNVCDHLHLEQVCLYLQHPSCTLDCGSGSQRYLTSMQAAVTITPASACCACCPKITNPSR